jgi:hypothetical protein
MSYNWGSTSGLSNVWDSSSNFLGGGGASSAASGAGGFFAGAGGPAITAALGAVGLPFEIASRRRQQDIMRSGLEAQLRAQNAALETNTMLSREGMYGQLGESLGARLFGQTAADLEKGRQFEARKWELGPGAEKDLAFRSDLGRRERSAAVSQDTQSAKRFENLLNMKRRQAEIEGGMAAMFGPKAPTNVSRMVVG